jgi:hypothetical protein
MYNDDQNNSLLLVIGSTAFTIAMALPAGLIIFVILKLVWRFRVPYVLLISGFALYSYFRTEFNREYFFTEMAHCMKGESCFDLRQADNLKRFHAIGAKYKNSPTDYRVYRLTYDNFFEIEKEKEEDKRKEAAKNRS